MMRIISFVLILTLVFVPPRSVHALTLPIGPAAAIGVVAIVGGTYIYLNSGAQSTVSNNSVHTPSTAYWYSRSAFDLSVTVLSRSLRASLPLDFVKSRASADPSKYPNLNAATTATVPTEPVVAPTGSAAVGSVIAGANGNFYKIGGAPSVWKTNATALDTGVVTGNVRWQTASGNVYTNSVGGYYYYAFNSGGNIYLQNLTLYSGSTTTRPLTSAEFGSKLAPSGTVSSATYQDELDKMMRDPDYVPTFTDDTGLPYAPPSSGVLTPEQAEARNQAAAAVAAAQAAVTAAQSAVTAAQNSHNQAVAALNADPSNPDKQNRANDTALALAQAEAALRAAELALQNKLAELAEQDSDTPAPVDPPPQLKSFNWTYANKLLGQLQTAWPFNLLLTLRGLFAPLESSPTAPVFDLPLLGNNIHIDLNPFNPLASITRWIFTVLLTAFGIMAVIRWYRGAS